MFFGTTAGEEKTIVLETPTVPEATISEFQDFFGSQKAFSIQGVYSQSPGSDGQSRVVIINSNLQELSAIGNTKLLPPFYCTGVLPNKNYPYGLQFNMVVDFDTSARNSITIKTKVYEPNSGGSGNVEIPTITISSLSGTLSDSDYEKLVNSDIAKFVSPLGTYIAFKYTFPQQQNNLYYYAYETNENAEILCNSIVITNGTTKTFVVNGYTIGGEFTPEKITLNFISTDNGTISASDFEKIKIGVPFIADVPVGDNTITMAFIPDSTIVAGDFVFFQSVSTTYNKGFLVGKTSSENTASFILGTAQLAKTSEPNTFGSKQTFEQGIDVGSTTSNKLTINDNGALTITDSNGTVGLNGNGLMYRAGGTTNVLRMPTDSVSANTEIVSKGYLDSRNYLKATNTTGALLTISNDNYIQLRSNIVNGGYFVVGNKTNTLPGFEVRDNSGNVVFDAKSKQGVVDIGTSTARMLFGSGTMPESKVVKFFTGDNNNILTFGLGSERLSVDYNGRVLFDVQTTTVSKDFNQVQSGEIAGRLDTGLTDENIIITSIYDTTNQVEFMQPYFDGTEWRATAICVAQGISGTSNVQIKYIRLP